jgi:hypothetical protein
MAIRNRSKSPIAIKTKRACGDGERAAAWSDRLEIAKQLDSGKFTHARIGALGNMPPYTDA